MNINIDHTQRLLLIAGLRLLAPRLSTSEDRNRLEFALAQLTSGRRVRPRGDYDNRDAIPGDLVVHQGRRSCRLEVVNASADQFVLEDPASPAKWTRQDTDAAVVDVSMLQFPEISESEIEEFVRRCVNATPLPASDAP